MQSLNTILKEVGEIFDKLGGEDLLGGYDLEVKDLPEGNLTRGYRWPETCHELDPDKVKTFLLKEVERAYEAGRRYRPVCTCPEIEQPKGGTGQFVRIGHLEGCLCE